MWAPGGSGAWRGGAEKVGCDSGNGAGGGSGAGGGRGIVWDVGPWRRQQRRWDVAAATARVATVARVAGSGEDPSAVGSDGDEEGGEAGLVVEVGEYERGGGGGAGEGAPEQKKITNEKKKREKKKREKKKRKKGIFVRWRKIRLESSKLKKVVQFC
uniref:Uncharacterized protein n=1 Tax=Ananas comosus var. bracteatus TaxID=296719 RepID=A0A6V7QC66_ANACO|nr:unnamed protein product [Ananas comosus var. bracteatus]